MKKKEHIAADRRQASWKQSSKSAVTSRSIAGQSSGGSRVYDKVNPEIWKWKAFTKERAIGKDERMLPLWVCRAFLNGDNTSDQQVRWERTMKATLQDISLSLSGLWYLLQLVLSYRQPMSVREVKVLVNTGYYVCPRCSLTMEWEFMSFCDRCGQCLNWKYYKKAKIVYPDRTRS